MSEIPSIPSLSRALGDGTLSATALTEQCLALIAQAAPGIFTEVLSDRARALANAASKRRAMGAERSVLDGVPFAVKDVFDVSGYVTTAASGTRRTAAPSAADADLIARLCGMGLVPVAKTNLSEFAFSGLGVNPHFGTPDCAGAWLHSEPRSPVLAEQARAPGGSSSGSAVAVSRGCVPWALGSDTSGSVRIPCAWNGLAGFRPSAQRYPSRGMFPLAPTLDVPGPMARTVEELRWLDAAMSGQSSGAPERLVKSPLPTVIVPIGTLLEGLEPIVERAYYAALAALQAVGWLVEERAVQALDDVVALQATHGTLVSAEAALVHAKLLKTETARQVHWPVLRRLVLAAHMPASVRVVLLQARARLCLEWDRQVGRCAVVALPTTAITAPLLRPLLDDADHFADVNALALRNTMPLSLLNAPSVSMPLPRLGSVEGELAGVGLMLSSVSGHDVQLLAWASLADMTLQSGVKY